MLLRLVTMLAHMKKTKKQPNAVKTTTAPISSPFVRTLPPEFTMPMGQVMVDWAFYEMRLQELVCVALNINTVQGRLAIKQAPALNMYELAIDLFALEGVVLPEANAEAFKTLAARRNLLAHGVWLQHGDELLLRDLTGTHIHNGKKVKRKVLPAGIEMTPESIVSLSKSIQIATADIEALILAAKERRSSSEKTHP